MPKWGLHMHMVNYVGGTKLSVCISNFVWPCGKAQNVMTSTDLLKKSHCSMLRLADMACLTSIVLVHASVLSSYYVAMNPSRSHGHMLKPKECICACVGECVCEREREGGGGSLYTDADSAQD